MVRISVITPSLNQGRFIERTIESVLTQDAPAFEYIVCDGRSSDTTPDVLARYGDRLKLVVESDRGQADAVNKGIRLTSGEVIGWLNSDDVYAPGALSVVAAQFDADADLDVLYGQAHLLDADDRVLGDYYTEPWNPARLVQRCFLCQPAVFFRRRVIDRFGLLDDGLHYSMDYEYWLRLAAGGATFAYLPTILAGSRLHPDTKTLGARLAVHQEIDAMLRSRVGRVPESWLINHAHTLVELRRQRVLPFALEVLAEAARLSWQWNGSLSRRLVLDMLRPIAAGARRRVSRVRS
ncbi:MAG TPA: glycosyltransferase family 2 protein [Chloroflexota bacterium]